MTLLLKQIFNFLKILNSETGTNQISAGIAFGFVLGMTPAFSLQTLFVFLCLLVFRIQMGAALLSAGFFAVFAIFLDPVFHSAGYAILTANALQVFFTSMYNMPIIPYTRFNDTIVMGSGVVSILLLPLVFVIAKYLVKTYRVKVVEKFKKTKFWKAVQATSFYKWYAKYDELYN